MGYIMPITQFEYIQYANRTVAAEKEMTKSIGGISPIIPLTFLHHLNQDKEQQIEDISLPKSEIKKDLFIRQDYPSYNNYVPEYVVEQIQADLTGIGVLFNEKV